MCYLRFIEATRYHLFGDVSFVLLLLPRSTLAKCINIFCARFFGVFVVFGKCQNKHFSFDCAETKCLRREMKLNKLINEFYIFFPQTTIPYGYRFVSLFFAFNRDNIWIIVHVSLKHMFFRWIAFAGRLFSVTSFRLCNCSLLPPKILLLKYSKASIGLIWKRFDCFIA